MSILVSILNNVAVSYFGSILSAAFCGALDSKRNRRIFGFCMAVLPLLQILSVSLLGSEVHRQIYPLIVHLPLVLLLYILTGKLLWPFISVLTAYLCCQLRRWTALLIVAVFSGLPIMQGIVELVVTLPILFLLMRFVVPAVRRLSGHSAKLQCQFGAIPALYYVFDYATMVYTNLLTSGSPVVVEFMPFVCCAAYLVFLLYRGTEV